MRPTLLLQLAGVAMLVMIANILCTVLYMVIYGHLINPGHADEFYQAHVQVAAPYCSIVAGIPLMFLAGWWVAGWKGSPTALRAALVVWGVYAVIDFTLLAMNGGLGTLAGIFALSFVTKLGAITAGAVLHERRRQPAHLAA